MRLSPKDRISCPHGLAAPQSPPPLHLEHFRAIKEGLSGPRTLSTSQASTSILKGLSIWGLGTETGRLEKGRCSPKFLGLPVSKSPGVPIQNADSCQYLVPPPVRISESETPSNFWYTVAVCDSPKWGKERLLVVVKLLGPKTNRLLGSPSSPISSCPLAGEVSRPSPSM